MTARLTAPKGVPSIEVDTGWRWHVYTSMPGIVGLNIGGASASHDYTVHTGPIADRDAFLANLARCGWKNVVAVRRVGRTTTTRSIKTWRSMAKYRPQRVPPSVAALLETLTPGP